MAKIVEMYTAIQNRLIEEYGIVFCDGCCPDSYIPCQYRGTDTPRCMYFNIETKENKRIRNWKQENTIESTFILLHEIGHTIEDGKVISINEYKASSFAIRRCKELGINLPRDIVVKYQKYVTQTYKVESCEVGCVYHMSGLYRPDWMTMPEDYSIVRVYDEVYDFDIREYVRNLNR